MPRAPGKAAGGLARPPASFPAQGVQVAPSWHGGVLRSAKGGLCVQGDQAAVGHIQRRLRGLEQQLDAAASPRHSSARPATLYQVGCPHKQGSAAPPGCLADRLHGMTRGTAEVYPAPHCKHALSMRSAGPCAGIRPVSSNRPARHRQLAAGHDQPAGAAAHAPAFCQPAGVVSCGPCTVTPGAGGAGETAPIPASASLRSSPTIHGRGVHRHARVGLS